MTPAFVPKQVLELMERFERNREAYRSGQYNETQLRREFLDPFFKALGWDIDNEQGYAEAYKDVIHEDAIRVGEATKAPDYCFRIGGARKFLLEAKKPAVDIKHDVSPAFQLRRYGFTTKLPLNILSDFEEFAVYDCRFKPDQHDNAAHGRILYIPYTEYVERWEEIANVFSRDAVLKGAFDKFAESTKAKRGTADMDHEFLKTIEGWRAELACNLAIRNPKLTQRELNFAVQRTIDRIIFLRICEGRGLEDYGRLRALANGDRIYPRLAQLFEQADDRYNSGLFHFKPEKGRRAAPDEPTLGLELDDKLLRDILKSLYYPDCPYVFSALAADILGQVYEQFLGKVIRLTEGHRAVVEEKPEVKKAGGVYYTPTYIVEYIVQSTIGKLLDECSRRGNEAESSDPSVHLLASAATGKALDARAASRILARVSKLRVVDPACGSGSFLLGAYEFLLKWHLDFYTRNDPTKWAKGSKPTLVQAAGGSWKLTIAERKRILLANIYGVDIDAQAVETTKLSLLLKVLEGETQQSLQPVLRTFQERALPDLGDNIKCGNSLIGPDFYQQQQMTLLDEEERYRINVFDWHAEFPHVFRRKISGGGLRETAAALPLDYEMPGVPLPGGYSQKKKTGEKTLLSLVPIESEWDGGFDAVIGNPPYIPIEMMSESEKDYYQACHSQLERKFDSAPIFILAMLQKLQRSGRIGFISSVTWQTGENFKELRKHLFKKAGIEVLLNLPFNVFKNAYVDTGVYILTSQPTGLYSIFRFPKKEKSTKLDDIPFTRVPVSLIAAPDFKVILDPAAHQIFCRTVGAPGFSRLGDFTISTQGLAGNKFRIDPVAKNELWYPFLAKGQAQRYYLDVEECAYADMSDKPSLTRFYEACPKLLIRRVISRQDRLLTAFTCKKLVYKKDINPFILSDDGWNVFFVLGVLNSRLISFLYVNTSSIATKDDFRQTTLAELRNLPIPKLRKNDARHDQMVKLVEQMLELHKQLSASRTPQERTSLERQITATDRQIDRRVYDLYGLTEEEIRIVEGESKTP